MLMFFERTFKKNFEKLRVWNRVHLFVMQKSAKTISFAFFVTSMKFDFYRHDERL